MKEEMEISRTMTAVFYIEGIGIISVGAIGCLINLAAIWRLTIGQGRRKRHTFHYLLISLSVYDLVSVIGIRTDKLIKTLGPQNSSRCRQVVVVQRSFMLH